MPYNYFPATYQPMMPQVQQVQNNGNHIIAWVKGIAGAETFFVPANTTAILFNTESDEFYTKSADASGIAMPLRTFSFTETTNNQTKAETIQTDNFITRSEFEELKTEIEKITKKQKKKEDE